MSKDEHNWMQTNFEFIAKTWLPVEDPESADLRLTSEQIAMKIFEYSQVPMGAIEMIQEKLLELGFHRAVITWDPIPGDPVWFRKDNCWAVCWLLKMRKAPPV